MSSSRTNTGDKIQSDAAREEGKRTHQQLARRRQGHKMQPPPGRRGTSEECRSEGQVGAAV
jgi:hypothetical protein